MDPYKEDSSKLHDLLFADYLLEVPEINYAKSLFFNYLETESEEVLKNIDIKILVKISVFFSCKSSPFPFKPFSAFFSSELVTWKANRDLFHRFASRSSLPDWVKSSIQDLVQSVDTSKGFFSKLNSVWKSLNVQGQQEVIKIVYCFIWVLFICTRKVLLLRSNDYDDCAYLMVGVLRFALTRLPARLALKDRTLENLNEFFKVQENEAIYWAEKVFLFLKERLAERGLSFKGDRLEGILSWGRIKENISVLDEFYSRMADWDSFDERILCDSEVEKKHFDNNERRRIQSRVLRYDEQVSNYNEVPGQSSRESTPISYTMETLKWIQKVITENFSGLGQEAQQGKSIDLQRDFEDLMTSKGESAAVTISICIDDNNLQLKLSCFYDSLQKILQKDNDEIFDKCLFIFCIESVFFVKNYVHISFSDLLDAYSCSGFDFFRHISIFSSLPSIPDRLNNHIKQIKVKILMHLGWKINGSIHLTIQDYLNNSNSKPLEDNFNKYKGIFPEDYEKFFDQMIIEVGIHIDLLCKALKIQETVCEKIWKTVKYILSEKTEIIFGRHTSLIILCSIFAVKKLENPIKFNDIVHEYWKIFGEDRGIFNEIVLQNGETAGIVEYYNKVFVNEVKDFIDNRIQPLVPRVASLNPNNSLVELVSSAGQQKKSPITTPRTQCLLASPYASGKSYMDIRPLSFEKKDNLRPPIFIKNVLDQDFDESIPEPVIKKNN